MKFEIFEKCPSSCFNFLQTIGFAESQKGLHVQGEELSSHDELMCNFFAQPDALAIGKTAREVKEENPSIPEEYIMHRVFKGNRPSLSLLLPKLNAYTTGQLLALYEHRTAVQGFLWDINSFDQWGVELGKQLAESIRTEMKIARTLQADNANLDESCRSANHLTVSTSKLLQKYWSSSPASQKNNEHPKDI